VGDRGRHLVGPLGPADRMQELHLLLHPRGSGRPELMPQSRVPLGGDRAERHGDHPHPVDPVLDGYGPGQPSIAPWAVM
jgi:hypothetical protein